MTGERFPELAARQVRRQRVLLALWRHTLTAPSFGSPESDDWLKERRNLLSQFALLREPSAETPEGVAAESLQAMQRRQLRVIGAIARLEALLLVRGQEQLRAAARALHVAARSRLAQQSYRGAGRPSTGRS